MLDCLVEFEDGEARIVVTGTARTRRLLGYYLLHQYYRIWAMIE